MTIDEYETMMRAAVDEYIEETTAPREKWLGRMVDLVRKAADDGCDAQQIINIVRATTSDAHLRQSGLFDQVD